MLQPVHVQLALTSMYQKELYSENTSIKHKHYQRNTSLRLPAKLNGTRQDHYMESITQRFNKHLA